MPPLPTTPTKVPIPTGTIVRMGVAATLCAVLLYLAMFWQPVPVIDPTDLGLAEPPLVAVPQIDHALLRKAQDQTREQRLFLEAEPLSHLLAQSLNVSDEAARALGRPQHMVPVAELRAAADEWRGRWLFYRGKVENLTGPRPGNPVPGYGIYEATLRLANGDAVLLAFSKTPGEGVHVGGWARAEGFLLKLRDVPFPTEVTEAPLLVCGELREDFQDWQPVRAIDPEQLAHVIDTQRDGDRIEPSTDSWRTIDEDQALPLWHLGAFARDGDQRTPQQWRQVQALNAQEVWDAFKQDAVDRGTPMRVLGTLASLRTVAAHPNPAGIAEWTEAWLQLRDLGGKTIPIWVPKEVHVPLGSSLEVRGFYYRRRAYESRRGQQYWTPLFVAADLDLFVFDPGNGMKQIGLIAMPCALALIAGMFWSHRREARRSLAGEAALTARRRRRREKADATPNAT